MIQLLKKPHPFLFDEYTVLVPAVITFLIVILFGPFQLSNLPLVHRVGVGGLLAVIVAGSIVVVITVLKMRVSNEYLEDKWTVGNEFLLVITVVLLISVIISAILLLLEFDKAAALPVIATSVGKTIMMSILPVMAGILFEQHRHLKKQLQKAEELTNMLENQKEELENQYQNYVALKEQTINIYENDKLKLRLKGNQLIYCQSDGNYVEVYLKQSNQIEKTLIRMHLWQFEQLLPSNTFVRCHNRYIINGDFVYKVEGMLEI